MSQADMLDCYIIERGPNFWVIAMKAQNQTTGVLTYSDHHTPTRPVVITWHPAQDSRPAPRELIATTPAGNMSRLGALIGGVPAIDNKTWISTVLLGLNRTGFVSDLVCRRWTDRFNAHDPPPAGPPPAAGSSVARPSEAALPLARQLVLRPPSLLPPRARPTLARSPSADSTAAGPSGAGPSGAGPSGAGPSGAGPSAPGPLAANILRNLSAPESQMTSTSTSGDSLAHTFSSTSSDEHSTTTKGSNASWEPPDPKKARTSTTTTTTGRRKALRSNRGRS